MKQLITLLAILMVLSTTAQVPQSFSYQGVARNISGQPLVSQSIGVQFSIIKTTVSGTVEYTETHSTTTNAYGLFTLGVGGGTPVTGTFAGIDWVQGPKFLKVEIDPAGGTSYTHIGTTQLLSVPYAQYAGNGDKTVTLTGQGGVQVSGTYPNFTIGLPPVQQFLPGGIVRGRVYAQDQFSNNLKAGGVTVKIDSISTTTDSTGWFELTNVIPGYRKLELIKSGFCALDIRVNVLPGGLTSNLPTSLLTICELPANPVTLDSVYVSGGAGGYVYIKKGSSSICATVYYSKDSASLSYSNHLGNSLIGGGQVHNVDYVSSIKSQLGLTAGGKVYFIIYPHSCGSSWTTDKYFRNVYGCELLTSPSVIRSITLP